MATNSGASDATHASDVDLLDTPRQPTTTTNKQKDKKTNLHTSTHVRTAARAPAAQQTRTRRKCSCVSAYSCESSAMMGASRELYDNVKYSSRSRRDTSDGRDCKKRTARERKQRRLESAPWLTSRLSQTANGGRHTDELIEAQRQLRQRHSGGGIDESALTLRLT